MAGLYREKLTSLDPADYPVLFWLRPALKGAKRVFDFGGHVGIAFYTYRHYLQWPADLTWTVCDVPAVVKAGESLAKSEGVGPQLRFTERVEEASGCDVLLALGAIQYMEPGFLPRTLERLEQRPRHVIVQRTPLHPTTSFVTLQATGLAFCPYAVANRGKMIDDLTKLGYELVDSWTQERSSEVPFHPELTVEHYAGLYFRLR